VTLELLHFFADELEKLASDSRRKRHGYYMRNRNKILQQQRQYRAKNRASIARRQKMYRRRVKAGAQRQRKRISTGHSYTYGGYR
jgi:collagenase-like PrtC family protease